MKAKRVARLGWFANFHAELHNHQDMRTYLFKKMMEAGVELDSEIFLQYVWCGPPTNRAITKALIFDVDSKQWNRGLAFFKNLRFDQNYSLVQFLPLMQQHHMEKHVLACFRAHNKYLHGPRPCGVWMAKDRCRCIKIRR